MFVYENPSPFGKKIGDCVIRAIAIATDLSWDEAFDVLTEYGRAFKNLPNANEVWGAYLKDNGFTRHAIENTCPDCYTIRDFCHDHPRGKYVVATGSHVVAAINGRYYDAWDSGEEIPQFYWEAE